MLNFYLYIKKSRFLKTEIGKRIFQSAFWTCLGTVAAKFFVLLAGILAARILGKDSYGELGLIRSTINMLVVFASFGLGVTASKYIAEFRVKDIGKAGNVYIVANLFAFLFSVFLSLLVFCIAPFIANDSLKSPDLIDEIRCGVLLLFFVSINAAQTGSLAGFEDFKNIAINTFIAGVCEFVFLSIGAYYWGVKGAILASGIAFFVLWLLNFFSIRKNLIRYKICYSISKLRIKDFQILWTFSLPATLSSLMTLPVLWYVKVLLVNNNGYSEMAVFDVAEQWRVIILFIPSALGQIILPMLSNINAEENLIDYHRVLRLNVLISLSVTLGVLLIVILLSAYIMRLYGQSFDDHIPLIILASSTLFTSFCTVVGQVIASKAKMWMSLFFNLIWGGMLFTFASLFLANGWGTRGLALAILFSYVIHSINQYLYLRFYLKIKL